MFRVNALPIASSGPIRGYGRVQRRFGALPKVLCQIGRPYLSQTSTPDRPSRTNGSMADHSSPGTGVLSSFCISAKR